MSLTLSPRSRQARATTAATALLPLVLCAAASAAAPQQAAKPKPGTAPKPGAASAQKPAATPKPSANPTIPAAAPPVKLPANVVAQVNGQNITTDQLLATLQAFAGRPLLQSLIQAAAVEQEAKKLGVTVTQAEVAAEIKKQKEAAVEANKMNTGTMTPWSQIAAREGVSDGYIEWNLRTSLLARKTFAKYIEKNVPTLDNQINLAHILIPTVDLTPPPPGTTPKTPTPEEEKARDEQALKKINEIREEIESGKISFEDAAKKYSADRTQDSQGQEVGSAANGGVLGYAPQGAYDPAFEMAGWKLEKPGDITKTPIRSRFGYHLIKLVQRGKDAPAAEKAAYKQQQIDQQMQQLQQNPQILGQYINSLVQQAKVNYNLSPQIAPVSASTGATKPAAPKPAASKPAAKKPAKP
jgi:Parvulin-like peptidyl-prolyl isomerase